MATTTAANPELGRKLVQRVVENYQKQTPAVYKEYLGKTISTNLAEYNYMQEGAFGTAVETPEVGSIPVDTFWTGNKKTLNGVKYALAFDVSSKAMRTDQLGVVGKYAPKLARSFQKTKEIVYSNAFFNLGFTSTNISPDATYIYANTTSGSGHATQDPMAMFSNRGIYRNSAYADVALGYFTLGQAIAEFTKAVDYRGIPDSIVGQKILVVHPDLEDLAYRLVNSANIPQSADNDPNRAGKRISKIVVNPFLTNAGYWYLLDAATNPTFELNMRGYDVYTKDNKADNDTVRFAAMEEYAPGIDTVWGLWGTTGV